MKMLINAIYPAYITSYGNGSACQSILEAMGSEDIDVKLFCISGDKSIRKSLHRFALPLWSKPIAYRLLSNRLRIKYTEWRYQCSLSDQDIAYLWAGTSIETYRIARSANRILLTESINTHQSTSKAILDAEYHRLGISPDHGIDEKLIYEENAKLELVDYVFSPSDEVSKSLLEAKVPREKIIRTSYGLDSVNMLLPEEIDSRTQRAELTAIFVGEINIRKGVHLLLEYWVKAGVNGKLKLVGSINPNVRHLIEPYLKLDNIEHIPFTRDLRSLYLNADIFILPSLEEGSPLVTYLALGAGLPSIVSPMGGGGIINDGCEGLVVNPHDTEGWVDAIRKLFSDTELRMHISKNAFNRAGEYLWSNVGKRRRELLLSSLKSRK